MTPSRQGRLGVRAVPRAPSPVLPDSIHSHRPALWPNLSLYAENVEGRGQNISVWALPRARETYTPRAFHFLVPPASHRFSPPGSDTSSGGWDSHSVVTERDGALDPGHTAVGTVPRGTSGSHYVVFSVLIVR